MNLISVDRVATWAAVLAICLGGCSLPDSMHVRKGGEPRYEDDDVLFRATYYFRVFDYCAQKNQGVRPSIKSDALYRFKMTGKGKAFIDQVRFESGTLQSWQIDPFGATIEFDKDSLKPYVVTQRQHEEQTKNRQILESVKLLEQKKENMNCTQAQGATSAHCAILDAKIVDQLQQLGGGPTPPEKLTLNAATNVLNNAAALIVPQPGVANTEVRVIRTAIDGLNKEMQKARDGVELKLALVSAKDFFSGLAAPSGSSNKVDKLTIRDGVNDDDKDTKYLNGVAEELGKLAQGMSALASAPGDLLIQSNLSCGDGLQARRGFQILGPEGWRTFDQDERLVLAMSSSGRPLLDALKEVSNRMLNQQAPGLTRDVGLSGYLAVAQARAKLTDLASAKPEDVAKTLDALVEAFNKKTGE